MMMNEWKNGRYIFPGNRFLGILIQKFMNFIAGYLLLLRIHDHSDHSTNLIFRNFHLFQSFDVLTVYLITSIIRRLTRFHLLKILEIPNGFLILNAHHARVCIKHFCWFPSFALPLPLGYHLHSPQLTPSAASQIIPLP